MSNGNTDLKNLKYEKANAICTTCPNAKKALCNNDEKEIRNQCGVSEEENEKFVEKRMKLNEKRKKENKEVKKYNATAPKNKRKKLKKTYRLRNKTWKDKHCKKLLFNTDKQAIEKRSKEMQKYAEDLVNEVQEKLDKLSYEMYKEIAWKIAKAQVTPTKILKKTACAALIFPWFIAACIVALTAKTARDVTNKINKEYLSKFKPINEELKQLEKYKTEADKALNALNDDPEGKKFKKWQDEKTTEMADEAMSNPCLKARACQLTTFDSTQQIKDKIPLPKEFNDATGKNPYYTSGDKLRPQFKGGKLTILESISEIHDARGCCGGQTGHHLIQGAWLKPEGTDRGDTTQYKCKKYNEDDAPAVCVVGINQDLGTHKTIHDKTNRELEKKLGKKGPCKNGSPWNVRLLSLQPPIKSSLRIVIKSVLKPN